VLEALAELSASYSSALCTQHWHHIICNDMKDGDISTCVVGWYQALSPLFHVQSPVYAALLIQISIRIQSGQCSVDTTYLDLNPDPDPDTNPHLNVDSIKISPVWRTPVYPQSGFASGY